MDTVAVLETVAPVFALMFVGYAFASLRRTDVTALTDIVLYLGGPALVFRSLVGSELGAADVGTLVAGTVWIVVFVGVAVTVVARVIGFEVGSLYLPMMFPNVGNMLLPLVWFAYGDEGLARGAVVFVTMTLLQSTVGVSIATGRPNWGEVLRLPYAHAAVAGLWVRTAGVAVPDMATRAVGLLADLAVPLMLLALGMRLATVRAGDWRRAALAAPVRLAGGFVAGSAFVAAFGVDGTTRSVLLLASVMPSAVVNFVFAEKYGDSGGEVAAAVVVTTTVSLVTTPLYLRFAV